jgi:carboxymethylenebutenolidase
MTDEITLQVNDGSMRALFGTPAGVGPFPGIVISYHKDGFDSFTKWLVDDLVHNGFAAIAPDHYHVLPPGKGPDDRKDYFTDTGLARDLEAARMHLERNETVDPEHLGILGHCMGGRAALLGATVDRCYKSACIWYCGSAFRAMGKGPSPVDRIPKIAAKVMGFFGNEDTNPSPEDVNKIDERMSQSNVWHEFYRYDGAAHAFMNPYGRGYRPEPAKDSWARALAFLKKELATQEMSKAER